MSYDVHSRDRRVMTVLVAAGLLAGVATVLDLTAPGHAAFSSLASSASVLLHGDVAPAPTAPAGSGRGHASPPADPQGDANQAGLVAADDIRVTHLVSGRPATVPFVDPAGPRTMPTLVLTARPRPYDLDDVERLGGVVRQPDASWLLTRSLFVAVGAELRIQDPGAILRMTSTPKGFASIVGKGTITLSGDATAPLTITSWDPAKNAPDVDETDGRAYIRGGARMDLSQVTVQRLGFWSGRTGGIAWTGSSHVWATGGATDVVVTGNHYGMFTSRAQGITIGHTSLRDNDLDGLLVHHGSNSLTATNLTAVGNGSDGVAIARGAEQVTLDGATVTGNTRDGIRVDGSPLATDATAGGAGTAHGGRYTVRGSRVTGNGDTGIVVIAADDVTLTHNVVTGSRDGVVVRGPATRSLIGDNTIDAAGFGVTVRNGVSAARVSDNHVRSTIGLHIVDSTAAVGNNTVNATRYGISLVGHDDGSAVTANTFAGRGLAAVDTKRLAAATTLDVTGNDAEAWQMERDNLRLGTDYVLNHPALLVWLGIVLLPMLARLRSRRRIRPRTLPYANPLAPRQLTYAPADARHAHAGPRTRLTLVSAGRAA